MGTRLALIGVACLALLSLSACAALGEMPQLVGVGCENRQGAGPRNVGDDPPGIPLAGIEGLTPAEATAAAGARGHIVVFRLDSMHCVCVPPLGYGPVAEGWWGSNGQLYVDLQDVRPQGNILLDGTGC